MNVIHLSTLDVALAALLVLFNAGVSLMWRLQLHRQVLWAAVRMVVQLLLVGLLLRFVFAATSWPVTFAVCIAMILAAAREVATRPARRLNRAGNYRIGLFVVAVSSIATVSLALLTAIRPQPWYTPQYAIPLLGMVLGTVLNSATLSLDTFFNGVVDQRGAIEARLALGDTIRDALGPLLRRAVRQGMIPVINQMSAAGIITLPGIMSGQILAGMDPVEAAKYQVLLLFLLTGASGLAVTMAVRLASRSITDSRERLRLERLT